ncbi:MAG: M1 family metallopeptidase [Synechococcales cyanobacterium RU_4_20]|nr:M1 family metallopeptidase [Synechococcales cyanobacterium RU_4_20]
MLFAGVGSWIFYNTTQLNAYQPPGKELTAAEVERRFKQHEALPMPVVTATKLKVELYPQKRYFVAEGEYQLKNNTKIPIRELHLLTFINLELANVTYLGATLREAQPEWGYYMYDLDKPLLPGETQTLRFTTSTKQPQGFKNQVDTDDVYMIHPNDVVSNGTNLYSPFILPFVGYTKMVEHKKAWQRHKLDLPPLDERMLPHDDPRGLSQPMMLTHLDWGTVDLTVGTSGEQTAIAPGNLIGQWQAHGRNYFRYQSQPKDRAKFTIYSAKYATYRNDNHRVPIEIYYHPEHDYNVALIAENLGEALTFYENNFGPYPFEQIRAVEHVYYDGMAFSEGGTVGIPEVLSWKSEAKGAGRDSVIGWPTYLLAHAWSEDQMIAADVEGGMTLRESISAYMSALYNRSRRSEAEQARYKRQFMRDFFRQLGKIDFQEPALDEVYNELPIAKHKGGMILELIESLIGQEAMISAIRGFLAEHRYQGPPYATVLDLRDAILAQADVEKQPFIRELFSEVLTFQVGLADARVESLGTDRYRVRLTVEAQKLYRPTLDEQRSAPLDAPVEVVLYDEAQQLIYRKKHRFTEKESVLTLEVDRRPVAAEVDPKLVFPSAFLQDNRKRLRSVTD